MSDEDRKTIRWCLDSEIEAMQRDIKRTGPKRDHYGMKQPDVREQHIQRLLSARRAIAQ